MQLTPEKTGWNSLPGELRNKIYHYVLDSARGFQHIPADGVIDLRHMQYLPWHAFCISKQIRQEMSAILYKGSNGRFRLYGYDWKYHLGRYFDFSQIKELEIVWDPIAIPGQHPESLRSLREYGLPYTHIMKLLRQLTIRLSQVEGFKRLAIEDPIAVCIPSAVIAAALTPWAEAVQKKSTETEVSTYVSEHLTGDTSIDKCTFSGMLRISPDILSRPDAATTSLREQIIVRKIAYNLSRNYACWSPWMSYLEEV